MSNKVAYVLTTDSVNLYLDGRLYTVNSDHISYKKILDGLKTGLSNEKLKELINTRKTISRVFGRKLRIEGEQFFYNDERIYHAAINQIIYYAKNGLPFARLVLWLENLLENPSYKVTETAWEFFKNGDFAITETGNFLAFKGVQQNWRDWHTGKFDNSIGKVVEERRNTVDDNPKHTCSKGLHAGTLAYAKGYVRGGRLIVVEINPKDIVSVPEERDAGKIRVCKYKVIAEYTDKMDTPLEKDYCFFTQLPKGKRNENQ